MPAVRWARVNVLCLNGGSSSLKIALVRATERGETRLARGEAKMTGDRTGAADALERAVSDAGIERPDAIGHRFVHGGPSQTAPLLLDPLARERLARAIPYAPLHLPSELALVDAAAKLYPDLPQVACFDTAFHATLPDVARRLPVAGWADDLGVRRFGFHGLSYEYVVSHLGANTLGNAAIAHLGSGASMAAIQGGRSVDTTMGMSPTGGLMMGTRTGDIDPGALVYLLSAKSWGASELEHFVNHECGLLGVSGTTADMQELLRARAGDASARLAVDLFVTTARKAIGGFAAVLGGLRTLVFTGGIGAKAAPIRAEICGGLGFLGVAVDPDKNAANEPVISPDGAACTVRVLETDEEVIIARHARTFLDQRREA